MISLVTTRVANALSPFSVLTIGTTAIVDLGGFDQQVAAVGGAADGVLRNTSLGNAPATLTIGGNVTRNFFGLISETGGAISIVKDGSGLQGFDNAANNFTGGVSLRGGTLRYGLDGSLGTGAITVDALEQSSYASMLPGTNDQPHRTSGIRKRTPSAPAARSSRPPASAALSMM